jgi:hypothetical protein
MYGVPRCLRPPGRPPARLPPPAPHGATGRPAYPGQRADPYLKPSAAGGLADLAQAVTGEVGQGRVAVDGHDEVGLGQDRPKDVHHAVLATEGKTPGVGAADPDGSGAEGEGLDHIGAGADAGVEQDRGAGGGVDDLGQAVEGGQAAVGWRPPWLEQ